MESFFSFHKKRFSQLVSFVTTKRMKQTYQYFGRLLACVYVCFFRFGDEISSICILTTDKSLIFLQKVPGVAISTCFKFEKKIILKFPAVFFSLKNADVFLGGI